MDLQQSIEGIYEPNISFEPVDIKVFNSLTDSEKKKQQNNPDYRSFIRKQSEVYEDPDADIFDVLEYSK